MLGVFGRYVTKATKRIEELYRTIISPDHRKAMREMNQELYNQWVEDSGLQGTMWDGGLTGKVSSRIQGFGNMMFRSSQGELTSDIEPYMQGSGAGQMVPSTASMSAFNLEEYTQPIIIDQLIQLNATLAEIRDSGIMTGDGVR